MKCQQCRAHPAHIQLNMRINHKQQQMHLCQKCYREIMQDMKSPSNMNPFGNHSSFGGHPFEQFFQGFGHPSSPEAMGNESQGIQQPGSGQGGGLLDDLGRNLTDAAQAGLIDPVIGRDEEVARVIESLNRRNKNNPVLIGEPGVGKTAIAEGLALKIVERKVPKKLWDKQVYLLDVASLVANTGIRGQFEERMKQLISGVRERKNVILFIDEIHLLVGAGSAEGSMDAGNILKPALARGELQVIGATTLKEYRDIEKDAALERRFQPVMVHEPGLEDALKIVQGLAPRYEDHHEIRYSEDALRACVTLSDRYIQDRFLPDKAIDLMDEAGSKRNLALSEGEDTDLQDRLQQIRVEKEAASKEEQYEKAAQLRDEELQLEQQLAAKENQAKESDARAEVSVEDIQRIIEQKTGIPITKLEQEEQSKLQHLGERLAANVIGQEEAVEKVTKAVRRSRAGLKAKTRPIGSFLFVGPTGVGKTELSKCLAEELFGTKDSMIRLDMSEYMEKHSVSKIIGSPPGYVGHEEAGQLTEKVRRNPYSIILLDEIEKAHPDVQHMFLQIMEDGQLTDSQGRTVSFKDVVLIMTSNAGSTEQKNTIGFGAPEAMEHEAKILDSLGDYFKPEFLNRFDSIVQFNSLTEDHLVQIVEIMVRDLQKNLQEQEIALTFTEDAKRKLAEMGYHPAFGARPLRRTLQEEVEDRIADLLLDEEDVGNIQVDVQDEQITVHKA